MIRTELAATRRYGRTAAALHWIIAVLIVSNLTLGFLFHQVPQSYRGGVIATHRSIGLTILLLTIVRIGWRIWRKPPELPEVLSRPERLLARTVHFALYGLMLALPLSGWIMSSADTPPRSVSFWTLAFPAFPFPALGEGALTAIHNGTAPIHRRLAWTMIGLLAIHVSGALKHQLIDREPELQRILPFSFRRRVPR